LEVRASTGICRAIELPITIGELAKVAEIVVKRWVEGFQVQVATLETVWTLRQPGMGFPMA
jgi:hypothetical protein